MDEHQRRGLLLALPLTTTLLSPPLVPVAPQQLPHPPAYPFSPSWHFPWMQGLLLHSFTSDRHLGSWKPSGQRQVKPLMPSLHVPPLWQGLLAHSSMLMLHMRPG